MGDPDQGHGSRLRLPGVGGFLADRLTDAVALLNSLPEISTSLRSIDQHVTSLDEEVIAMRAGVSHLEAEVGVLEREIRELRGEIELLSGHVEDVTSQVARLEPHVAAVGRLASPLRRGRRRVRDGETETAFEALALTDSVDDDPQSGASAA